MAGVIATIPKYQFSDATGTPLAGGTLTTYIAGTNTLTNTWQDQALSIANTNPIALDSRGECVLWLSSSVAYKFVLKNSAGVTQWTVDNISGADNGLRDALAASSGASLVGFLQSGTGATARTAQSKLRDVVSVKDFGAVGDGSTDDYTAIANAITAVSATGGTVYFPSGNYRHNSTITLPSNVFLSGYGATLTYGGAGTGIQTSTTGWTGYAGMEGFSIDFGSATTALQINTGVRCQFRDLVFTGTSYTNTLIRLACNTSGATNPGGNYNTVFCLFENILCSAICGTFIQLQGNGSAGAGTAFVTLNTFVNVQTNGPPAGCCVYGIDFNKWCDSNVFNGMTRINLPNIAQAVNAVGMVQNSAGPTQSYGCYNSSFQALAVDTFGAVASDNRRGVLLNFSAQIVVSMFYQTPVAAGGDLIVGANAYSYQITKSYDASTNNLQTNFYGTNVGIGGSKSLSYSLYLSNFTLTGNNQASIVVADTFASASTGTSAGLTLQNSTQATAFTMSAYYGLNITNLNKGAGSTVTAQAGVYIADLTAGTTNYGIQSLVTAGTNKWGLYLSGGARNFLGAGGVEVAAGATTMTAGFTHVPSAAGAPTGAPTNPTGNVPLYYDSTNNRLYAYNGGTWRSVVLA